MVDIWYFVDYGHQLKMSQSNYLAESRACIYFTNFYLFLHQGDFVFTPDCLFVSRITQKALRGFPPNLVEGENMDPKSYISVQRNFFSL